MAKSFKKPASEFFINTSSPGEDRKQETQAATSDNLEGFTIPRGYKLTKEARSERIQLLVRPSSKELLKAEADNAGKSLNEHVNEILEDYLRKGGK